MRAMAEPQPAPDELTAAIAAGEHRRAITLLMREHGDAVYRYVRQVVRDPALADDVHQRVFVEAYRDLGRFGGRSAVRTWLFGIARHRCLDALKGARRRDAHHEPDDAPLEAAPDPTPAAGERIDQRRLVDALGRCLDVLAPAARIAVLLRFREGFSYEEMSGMCGERAGTLQQRVTRSLPVLRRCIEERTGGAV
jgi:RNA polymerase sigma-70 factor (ECF subfamily)